MRKLLVVALLALLCAGLMGASPALSKRKAVAVDDNYFVGSGGPRTVSVKAGDTVVWAWHGRNPHNVTVTRGPARFASRTKSSGTYRKKLTQTGTYKLVCTVHAPAMRMTLKVK
jgi:plastocyanin